MSDTSGGSSDLDNAGVKAAITLGIIAIAGVFSVVMAKICQYCRKKRLIPDDDESDISDHTRHIIRTRLAVIQFKKNEIRRAQRAKTLGFLQKWIKRVRDKKKVNNGIPNTEKSKNNEKDKIVVSIEQTESVKYKENGGLVLENGGVKTDNGSPRKTRFPFFASSKGGGGAPKSQDSVRVIDPGGSVVESGSPVARGRPVSSKPRALPNVTVTTAEVTNSTKIQTRSIQMEDDSKPKINGHVGAQTPNRTDNNNKPFTLNVETLNSLPNKPTAVNGGTEKGTVTVEVKAEIT